MIRKKANELKELELETTCESGEHTVEKTMTRERKPVATCGLENILMSDACRQSDQNLGLYTPSLNLPSRLCLALASGQGIPSFGPFLTFDSKLCMHVLFRIPNS